MSTDNKNKTASSKWTFSIEGNQKQEDQKEAELDSNDDSVVKYNIKLTEAPIYQRDEDLEASLKIDEGATTLYKLSRAQMAEDEEKSSFLKKSIYTGTYKQHKFKVTDADVVLRLLAFFIDIVIFFIAFKLIDAFQYQYELFYIENFTHHLDQYFPLMMIDFSASISNIPFYGDMINDILVSIYEQEIRLGDIFTLFIFINFMIIFYILPLSWKGKSVGCFLTQTELIHNDHEFLTLDRVFLRQFLVFPFSIMTMIGPLLIFIPPRRAPLHDLIMRSRMIKSAKKH